MTDAKEDGNRHGERTTQAAERLERFLAANRVLVDRAVGAFNVGRASLTVLAMALDEGRPGLAPRLDTAVSAAERAQDSAKAFLEMAGSARMRAEHWPLEYNLTCPGCGHVNITTRNDDIPPCGFNPVKCEGCGRTIFIKRDRDPAETRGDSGAPSIPAAGIEREGPSVPDAARSDGAVSLTDSQRIAAINELTHAAWLSGIVGAEFLHESDNYVVLHGANLEEHVEDARHFFAQALERTEIVLRLIRSWPAAESGKRELSEKDPVGGVHEPVLTGDYKRRAEGV